MQKLTMFILKSCPYCRQALEWMRQLQDENKDYAALEVDIIDEREDPALSDSYDYYYVPTFFLGDKKLHEGAATRDKIKAVFDQALG